MKHNKEVPVRLAGGPLDGQTVFVYPCQNIFIPMWPSLDKHVYKVSLWGDERVGDYDGIESHVCGPDCTVDM